jgi:hypothetical protein
VSDPTALDPSFYDAELRPHTIHLHVAASVRRDDHVLDIGCGGFTDLREPVYYGATADDAYDAMLRIGHARDLGDTSSADHARGRLRAMISDHDTGDGVLFDSAAWMVTGRRR